MEKESIYDDILNVQKDKMYTAYEYREKKSNGIRQKQKLNINCVFEMLFECFRPVKSASLF